MDKIKMSELTLESYNNLEDSNIFTYNSLFDILNFNNDIELCEKARIKIYQTILLDFLKNYLKADYFDEKISESFEVFKFFSTLVNDSNIYQTILKNHITSNASEYSIENAWHSLNVDDLNLIELSSIIINCKYASIQELAWDIFMERVKYSLDDKVHDEENPFDALFDICYSSKNEIFAAECWRIIKENEFSNETYLDLVLQNSNPEISEYAWKHIIPSTLNENELIAVIKNTASKKIAHEALDIFRKSRE